MNCRGYEIMCCEADCVVLDTSGIWWVCDYDEWWEGFSTTTLNTTTTEWKQLLNNNNKYIE